MLDLRGGVVVGWGADGEREGGIRLVASFMERRS